MKVPENKKFKILFVSSDKFPPFRVDVSVLFGKKLVEHGHDIYFLLQSDGPAERSFYATWTGCTVFVGRTDNGTSLFSRARKNLYRIFHELEMLHLLRRNNYDFLLVKDIFFSAFIGLLASKATRAKFIYWLSYPFPEADLFEVAEGSARYPLIYWMRGHLIRFLLYRLVLPFADHVFVQSDEMRMDVAKKGIPVSRLTAVPMGVEIDEIPFFGYETQSSKLPREKVVLYLGTLLKVRRMEFLIRVFAKIFEKDRTVRLFLVGGGEDPSDELILMEEAERLGIRNAVVVTGFLPRHDAWEFVCNADVCVSPIHPTPIFNVSCPTKIIEYMAMGKAVVANDIPDQKSVLTESGAGICVAYEESLFSEAILYLLNHPQVAAEMGKRGRAYIESHRDYDIITNRVQEKLWEVLAE